MGLPSRRDFLKTFGQTVPTLLLSRQEFGKPSQQTSNIPAEYLTPISLQRYLDPLPIPATLKPTATRSGVENYDVHMREFRSLMHSQLPAIRRWGYNAQCPGPTIEAFRGRAIEVHWHNDLPTEHLFKVDQKIHGAMPPAPAVRTVPHLHGARTRPESDGLPEAWFVPGHKVRYYYENQQPAATLWYHDHAAGITRLNAYAGLSGFYLLRDDAERSMGLPAGACEVPLMLQDRTLDEAGQLVYDPTFDDGTPLAPGVWGSEFFGQLPTVNGAIYPYLNVEPRPYRLRVLNSSNSRFYNLYFNLAKRPTDIPSLVTFHQIGTDGGFLPGPVELSKVLVAPAERADLIIDFSEHAGKTITLSNDAAAPYPGWDFAIAHRPQLYELMQFRVVLPRTGQVTAVDMRATSASVPINPKDSVRTRDFVLTEQMDAQGRSIAMLINGKRYDDPITETVRLGSTETWRFINTTDDSHPMHLHLVQFRILHRQGFDMAAYRSGRLELVGQVRPPEANEAGRKDTAVVNPRDVLTILVRFDGYAGKYVYHCHMLEHEDNDMMRPYEVVA